MVSFTAKRLALGALATCLAGAPDSLQSAEPGGLASLETGEWELTERGSKAKPNRLCVTDGNQLLQPNHANRQCRRYVIRSTPREVSASFDCAEGGQGRTDLRIETSRLIQLSSQGVFDGRPYSVALEGRRVGACRSTALGRR